MTPSKGYLLIGLLALLAGCQSPSRPPVQSSVPEDPAAMAARALAGGRHAEALELYRKALAEAPGKAALHYGFGVASSYLDRRDDAVREFRWVVQYGPENAPEVAAARQWLIRAGALPPTNLATLAPSRAGQERQVGNASLEGRAVFAETGQTPKPMARKQLFLVPESPTQKEHYNLRTDEEGNFKFPDVVPGRYKLIDRVAGQPTWRLRVEFKPSETKVLELTPANSLAMQDDFPERQAQAQK
jgi:tetratricopeptide (TPR) repeat protein